ncbi:hypothetical protein L1887_08611 [Cichorium endivia]|nr:hypothetical protein L1887_08611 [Cichorium endivia]
MVEVPSHDFPIYENVFQAFCKSSKFCAFEIVFGEKVLLRVVSSLLTHHIPEPSSLTSSVSFSVSIFLSFFSNFFFRFIDKRNIQSQQTAQNQV